MTFILPNDSSSGLANGDVLTAEHLEENFSAIELMLNHFPNGASSGVGSEGAGGIVANAITFAMIGCEATATSLGTSDELLPTQNAVKAYVDAQIAAIPSVALGSFQTDDDTPATLIAGHRYKVTGDGFVVGNTTAAYSNAFECLTSPDDSTWLMKARQYAIEEGFIMHGSFTVPVPKDTYWKVSPAATSYVLYWIALGDGVCQDQGAV